MSKICFDCLNSTSGCCSKHTREIEEKYTYTATVSTMTKQDIIKSLEIQKKQLIKEVKKRDREFMLLFVLMPVFFMMMILIIKTNLILFIGFGISWYYADKFDNKLK